MTLTEARAWVRQFARNAGASNYDDDHVDRAIQHVGNRFCRVTRALRKKYESASIVADEDSVPLSLTAGSSSIILPESIIDVLVSDVAKPLNLVDFTEVHRRRVEEPASGPPEYGAIETNDTLVTDTAGLLTLELWPTNGESRTATVRFWVPFSSWVAGIDEVDADDLVLNLPDHWLTEILTYGPAAVLQHNEPEHEYASESWKKYLEFERSMVGAGSLAVRTARRTMQQ